MADRGSLHGSFGPLITQIDAAGLTLKRVASMKEATIVARLGWRPADAAALLLALDAPLLTRTEATGLVMATEVRTRTDLARHMPEQLRDLVDRSPKANARQRKALDFARLRELVAWAQGRPIELFEQRIDDDVLDDVRRVLVDVAAQNPGMTVPADLSYLAAPSTRMAVLTEIAGHLQAAGVTDIHDVPEITVSGVRRIGGGVHVGALPPVLAAPSFSASVTAPTARPLAAPIAFSTSSSVPGAFEGVLITPQLDFSNGAELMIEAGCTELFIITDEIINGDQGRITWEGSNQDVPLRQPLVGNGGTGVPNHNRSVHIPGAGSSAASGGNGRDGSDGQHGVSGDVGPPASLKIYVHRAPQGLPEIDLAGRDGGRGQDGQRGGAGGNGARGRPSAGFLSFCTRAQGHGGPGGDGGDGGNGGIGGVGGSGGDVLIITLADTFASLAPPDVRLVGGTGGLPGLRGLGGPAGRGGQGGASSRACPPPFDVDTQQPVSLSGPDGSVGIAGAPGARGQMGETGLFNLLPFLQEDGSVVITGPWIHSISPPSVIAGDTVDLVTLFVVAPDVDVQVLWDGAALDASSVELIAPDVVRFEAPVDASGGSHTVQIAVVHPSGSDAHSQVVEIAVRPHIGTITPSQPAPGTRLTIAGSGFVDGCAVRLGPTELLPPVGQVSPDEISFTLPDHQNLALADGQYQLQVINPDDQASNAVSVPFTRRLQLRIRAWRVVDSFGLVNGEDLMLSASRIRDFFATTPTTLPEVFAPHEIDLTLDPRIDDIVIDANAMSWPYADGMGWNEHLDFVRNGDDNGATAFDPEAINLYVVVDIPGSTIGFALVRQTQDAAMFIKGGNPWFTPTMRVSTMAHELGHLLGLEHVCEHDGDTSDTFFGRTCVLSTDHEYLMYPNTLLLRPQGMTLDPLEAQTARGVAAVWHGR